jgi:hypothetical protein
MSESMSRDLTEAERQAELENKSAAHGMTIQNQWSSWTRAAPAPGIEPE